MAKRKTKKKSRIESERAEQIKVVDWAKDQVTLGLHPDLDMLYHIPNETTVENKWEGHWLNRAGRKKGHPDLALPVARVDWTGETVAIYHGMIIEMKRNGEAAREEQEVWLNKYFAQGWFAISVDSGEEAIREMNWYINLMPHVEFQKLFNGHIEFITELKKLKRE